MVPGARLAPRVGSSFRSLWQPEATFDSDSDLRLVGRERVLLGLVKELRDRVRNILETGVGLDEMAGNARGIDRKPN